MTAAGALLGVEPLAPPAGVGDWLLGGDRNWSSTLPVVGWTLIGRAVFLAAAAVTILLLAGIGVALSEKPELRRRWVTWAVIIPVVGIPIWMGRPTTAVLAALLALQGVREFSRLARLPRSETLMLGPPSPPATPWPPGCAPGCWGWHR